MSSSPPNKSIRIGESSTTIHGTPTAATTATNRASTIVTPTARTAVGNNQRSVLTSLTREEINLINAVVEAESQYENQHQGPTTITQDQPNQPPPDLTPKNPEPVAVMQPRRRGFARVLPQPIQAPLNQVLPPINLDLFQFQPNQVYSNIGLGATAFKFNSIRQLLPYVRADKYGDRVAGVLTGAEQVLGILQDNNVDNTGDGFNLPQLPPVQNEFTGWVNIMMGDKLRAIGVEAMPIYTNASYIQDTTLFIGNRPMNFIATIKCLKDGKPSDTNR